MIFRHSPSTCHHTRYETSLNDQELINQFISHLLAKQSDHHCEWDIQREWQFAE